MTPDLTIRSLGTARLDSPLMGRRESYGTRPAFVDDRTRVSMSVEYDGPPPADMPGFEKAGPRRKVFFDPRRVRAAIVSCGGLCPGLNDVIRAVVLELHHWYGVAEVLGIRYGYGGLAAQPAYAPEHLTVTDVADIHLKGGTILGSSRGTPPVPEMVDSLVRLGVNVVFCIGGDGTLRGAHEIAEEVLARGLEIAVVGIPKTIDNDIQYVYRSFGFQTAVEEANKVLDCAHVEALGAPNGVGLVKLMGRNSGFIASYATLASGDVNYCLVPEIPLVLEGEKGFLAQLRDRLRQRRHAVIALAEGAGRELMGDSGRCDASGNVLFDDIGLLLKDRIQTAFKAWGEEIHIKYFDPSYLIRSVPANSSDSIFCANLARRAVHAAMAGRTDLLIGYWHGVFTHVPLRAVAGIQRTVEPDQSLWLSVLTSTGQPYSWS